MSTPAGVCQILCWFTWAVRNWKKNDLLGKNVSIYCQLLWHIPNLKQRQARKSVRTMTDKHGQTSSNFMAFPFKSGSIKFPTWTKSGWQQVPETAGEPRRCEARAALFNSILVRSSLGVWSLLLYGLYHVVSMFCVTCRGWNFDLRKEIQQDRWHERMKVVASCWLCPKSEFTRHNYPYCIEIAISMECLCLAAHRVIFVLAILTVSLDGKLKPCRMAVSKPTKVAAAPECSVSWSSNFMLKPSREWRLPSGNLTYK